ncbi:hypothetical protein DQ04_03161040 [Trypanosoma grayi]|uniref:hypothetical protein n=1 Tax=Trypanosoma grayi TaxID=71804 RepID=UPI0004F415D2|nr:hypothetical protein DQ04_03161040 [Trypanosoma grayi]KEG10908.1 hypothetical protein DQ04_03161040 [Trypanosoma grayi]
MCGYDIIEWMGGTSRFITFLTFLIHFLHPLLCIANYCAWVTYQEEVLGAPLRIAYLVMSIIAAVSYLFVASIFYMWAWRFPEPEEVSKRRRIYGIVVNLLFSDIPMFVIEVKICWKVQFAHGVQGTSFVITCISLMYSAVRVWTFIMIKLIKLRAPVVGTQPQFSGSVMYPSSSRPPGPSGSFYPGNNTMRDGYYPGGSGIDHQNDRNSYPQDRYAQGDAYWRETPYTERRYSGDQYSTPGRPSRSVY